MTMNLYQFRGANGDFLEILAQGESDARREIMRARYGDTPDNVTPRAPNYAGYGLNLLNCVYDYKGKAPEPIARIKH